MIELKSLIDKIYPFESSAVLLGAALFLSFFGLSDRKSIKIFAIIFSALALAYALVLNIQNYIIKGVFSNYLFNFSFLQMIEFSLVIFIALNILIFVSINNIKKKNFIRIILIYILTVFCAGIYILSNNFLMVFTSLTFFIIFIFQVITIVNSNNRVEGLETVDEYSIKNHILKYFLISLFSLLLILIGFSLIFGATDFKSFSQIIETEKIENTLCITGIFIIFVSLYFYFFIFPFQSGYIKLLKRCEQSSKLILWFFYFPAGLFLFLKLKEVLNYFIEKNGNYIAAVLLVIGLLLAVGGNVGAIKTTSLRRILSFLYLCCLSFTIIAVVIYSFDLIDDKRLDFIIFLNFIVTFMCYLPLFAIFSEIEKGENKELKDSVFGIYGFARKNRFIGGVLIFVLLSFGGLFGTVGYLLRFFLIKPIFNYFIDNNVFKLIIFNKDYFKSFASVLLFLTAIITIIIFLFLIANVMRIIVIMLKRVDIQKPQVESKLMSNFKFSKFHIFYITFYSILILFLGIIGLLGILNINIGFNVFI